MPTFDEPALLDALSAPVGDLIASVGEGIASAQRDMDLGTLALLREVYGGEDEALRALQKIGWRPTWYQIPEAEAEISVALTITGAAERTGAARVKAYAAPVDAGYTGRYGYELKAASRVRFRIVPVPEPVAAERLRLVPALVGLSLGEASDLLVSLGMPIDAPASASRATLVATQSPAPGEPLGDAAVRLGV